MSALFHVATEFRFDIGHALLESEKLQGAVEGISNAANKVDLSFQNLGQSIAFNMGFGTNIFLGMVKKAIFSADKFRQTQIALTNIMGNDMFDEAGKPLVDFNKKLLIAENILNNMRDAANEFGLPADDLITMTKTLAPILKSKGALGINFQGASDMSRTLLKSAPVLGVQPGDVMGQLLRITEGQASMGDTLFTRLISDTTAMGKFKKTGSKGFNAMPDAQRLKVLQEALAQFAKDPAVLAANLNTIGAQFNKLNNIFASTVSILKPLGDALLPIIVDTMKKINAYMETSGARLVKVVAGFTKDLTSKGLENLYINIKQLGHLKSDVKLASAIFSIMGMTTALIGLVRWLGLMPQALAGVTTAMGLLWTGLKFVGSLFTFARVFTVVGFLFKGLLFIFTRLIWPITLLIGLLQLFSRAREIASLEEKKSMAELAPRAAEAARRTSQIWGTFFDPLFVAFDALARGLSYVFRLDFWYTIGVSIVEAFNSASIAVFGFLAGFNNMINTLLSGNFQLSNFGESMKNAFNEGYDNFVKSTLDDVKDGKASVQQTTNLNGNITIKQDFKEGAQPDRIAFTLVDQLNKIAQNPRGAMGRSMAGGLVGG